MAEYYCKYLYDTGGLGLTLQVLAENANNE